MEPKKIIYYHDELNDEFSEAKIEPRRIDKNYCYIPKNPVWNIASLLAQNVISMPIKVLYSVIKFRLRFIGKEKLKPFRHGEGYFMYVNHTQPFADTFIPSLANYPKRNFFIVNPENVSIKFLGKIVEMLGALPIPCDVDGMKNFVKAVETRIKQNYSVTIYPEAHIWPYYTGIRNFKEVSFKYPVKLDKPVFCITNTYQKRGRKQDKIQIVSYIDGPFYADKSLSAKEQQHELRNRVYECMVERAKNSNVNYIEYRKAEDTKEK